MPGQLFLALQSLACHLLEEAFPNCSSLKELCHPALLSANILKLFFLELYTFVIIHLFVYMCIICLSPGAESGFRAVKLIRTMKLTCVEEGVFRKRNIKSQIQN